jgi:hypothetical protein
VKRHYHLEINEPQGWDDEDTEWMLERLNSTLGGLLIREDYSLKEIPK